MDCQSDFSSSDIPGCSPENFDEDNNFLAYQDLNIWKNVSKIVTSAN